jgi:PAS domain S-box-containing protein
LALLVAAGLAFPVGSPTTADSSGFGGAWLALGLASSVRRRKPRPAPDAGLDRALLNALPDPLCLLDPDDGFRMVFANDAYSRYFGLSRESRSQLRLPELVPGLGAEGLKALFAELRQHRHRNTEMDLRLSKGGFVAVAVTLSLLVHEGRELVAASSRETGGPKARDAAGDGTDASFRALADAAPVLIWVAGTDKLCTWFNQPWLDFTGRTLAQEVGDGWIEGVHPDDLDRSVRTYMESFDARRPFRVEYRLRRHDGAFRWLLDSGQPRFQAGGRFLRYVGSCVDITEHKEMV